MGIGIYPGWLNFNPKPSIREQFVLFHHSYGIIFDLQAIAVVRQGYECIDLRPVLQAEPQGLPSGCRESDTTGGYNRLC